MKAIITREAGGPEVLEIQEVPTPKAAPGEVLIRAHASAINGADLLQRAGQYSPPEGASEIIGLEAAGEVAEVGEGVTSFKKGDRVMTLVDGGGYAEFVSAPQGQVMALPDSLDFEEGAAIPEVWLTAFLELVWLGKLQKGEDLLIHAGASGVGTAGIQIAKALGANVIVTAGSEEKLQFCKELGADVCINYNTQCFREVIQQTTGGKKFASGIPLIGNTQQWGVDVILDLVGPVHFPKNLDVLNLEGRLLLVGTGSGVKAEIDNIGKIIGKRLSIIGSTLRARPKPQKAQLVKDFSDFALGKFADGSFKPVIDRSFPLAEARQAHEFMESKKNKGKIILKM